MAVFVDRKSTNPHRYKITLESGETFYAIIERADEPLVEGTPLNAETLNDILSDPYVSATVE